MCQVLRELICSAFKRSYGAVRCSQKQDVPAILIHFWCLLPPTLNYSVSCWRSRRWTSLVRGSSGLVKWEVEQVYRISKVAKKQCHGEVGSGRRTTFKACFKSPKTGSVKQLYLSLVSLLALTDI